MKKIGFISMLAISATVSFKAFAGTTNFLCSRSPVELTLEVPVKISGRNLVYNGKPLGGFNGRTTYVRKIERMLTTKYPVQLYQIALTDGDWNWAMVCSKNSNSRQSAAGPRSSEGTDRGLPLLYGGLLYTEHPPLEAGDHFY